LAQAARGHHLHLPKALMVAIQLFQLQPQLVAVVEEVI
jgi:hypothetical protein